MIFDHEARPNGVSPITGDVLTEAMPWIKHVTGSTIVIKYGGAAMVDEKLREDVMADIILLKLIGVNPVLVHGGGKAINRAMEDAKLEVEFVDGLRVTTDEAIDIVRKTLVGEVNQDLVKAMNMHGNMAVGLSGADARLIVAEQLDERLGRVGKVVDINAEVISDLIKSDFIPIIASVALGEDGSFYNVNADFVAGHIAAQIGAHKVIFMTDVDGFYLDYPKQDSFVSCISVDEAKKIIAEGGNTGGMIPKLESAVLAIDGGAHRAHIVNGTIPHALILETLTDKGIGTMITTLEEPDLDELAPLSNFAARLV